MPLSRDPGVLGRRRHSGVNMLCWVPGGEAGTEASSTVSRPSENSEMQGSMRRKHLGFMRALF